MALNRFTAVQLELIRKGHEKGTRLKSILQSLTSSSLAAAEDGGGEESAALVDEILSIFSELLLNKLGDHRGMQDSVDPDFMASKVDSPCSETSSEKKRTCTGDDRRGSYRRPRVQPTKWIRVHDEKFDDGHIWRKYGQKQIQGNNHPRSYFRCTHKISQGCQAVRQLQREGNDPPTFIITYIGDHTCKKLEQRLMATSQMDDPNLISFAAKPANNKDKDLMPRQSSSWPPQKFHYHEEDIRCDSAPSCSAADNLITVEALDAVFSRIPGTTQHVADFSGFDSSRSFDMSFLAGSMELNDDELFNCDMEEIS